MAYSRKTKEQSKGKYTALKQRLELLALALVVYRIGAHIPAPGIDPDMLQQLFNQQQGGILGLFNMFSGGALSRFSLFALGIMPYISAAFILHMLSYVMPSLEALRKEGESGRRKITQYTRYTTLFLGLIQAFSISAALQTQPGLVINPGVVFQFSCVVSLVTGTMFLMWLGEQITEFGIGNGISIILFVSIVARFPNSIIRQINNVANGDLAWWVLVLMYLGALLLIVLIVLAVIVAVLRLLYCRKLKKAVAAGTMTEEEAATLRKQGLRMWLGEERAKLQAKHAASKEAKEAKRAAAAEAKAATEAQAAAKAAEEAAETAPADSAEAAQAPAEPDAPEAAPEAEPEAAAEGSAESAQAPAEEADTDDADAPQHP